MIDTVLNMFSDIFACIADLYVRIFDAVPGGLMIVLCGFLMNLVTVRLLIPIIGSAMSDEAQPRKMPMFVKRGKVEQIENKKGD